MEDLWINVKKFIWEQTYGRYYRYKYWQTSPVRENLHILNSVETIEYIVNNHCSISRFGDGEFQMITHYENHGTADNFQIDTFQHYNAELACRLEEVFSVPVPNLLVCMPYAFRDSSVHKGYQRIFFEREWLLREKYVCSHITNNVLYGDASFTRFYYGRCDIKDYHNYICILKQIWDNKKLLIVEGEQSRLGIGNDLFDNAILIHRILCPATDAFSKYDQILSAIKEVPHDYLVLIALGHTATVLAYDLTKSGYQAIDIGHIDIEYEWMRMKAKSKVAVPNKYVNESNEGRIKTDLNDPVYQSQIIKHIK